MRLPKPQALTRYALSAREAAAFLGLSMRSVQHYAQRGQIPHRRVGKKYLFSESALRQWLEQGEGSGE